MGSCGSSLNFVHCNWEKYDNFDVSWWLEASILMRWIKSKDTSVLEVTDESYDL